MARYVKIEEENSLGDAIRHIARPMNFIVRMKEKKYLNENLDESPCYYCKTTMKSGATICPQCRAYRTAAPDGFIGKLLSIVGFWAVVFFILGILILLGVGEPEKQGISVTYGIVMLVASIAASFIVFKYTPIGIYWYGSRADAE